MDRVNYMMQDVGVDKHLRQAARQYLINTRAAIKRQTYPDVIKRFEASTKLHASLASSLGAGLLQNVPYFRALSEEMSKPRFCDGDEVRVMRTHIIHVESGQVVPRVHVHIESGKVLPRRCLQTASVRDAELLVSSSFQGVVNESSGITSLRLTSEMERPGALIDVGKNVPEDCRQKDVWPEWARTGRVAVCFYNVRRNTIPEEEQGFLANIALNLQPRVYAPKESIELDDLQIIMKGVVGQNGQVLTYGRIFGHDMIMSSEGLREKRPVVAISYVETAALTRADLDKVCEDFPACARMLRTSAAVLALERALPTAAAHRIMRSCPFPMHGIGKPKVRDRWKRAMLYVLNESSDPLAVRKQVKFANREETRMLKALAKASGKPMMVIKKVQDHQSVKEVIEAVGPMPRGEAASPRPSPRPSRPPLGTRQSSVEAVGMTLPRTLSSV